MTLREKLELAVYKKAEEEQQAYMDQLRTKTADEILDNAYRVTIQQESLAALENPCDLTDKDLKVLLKAENILESCYEKWFDSEISYLDDLRDLMCDLAEELSDSLDADTKAVESE